jgi:hypothetical protein
VNLKENAGPIATIIAIVAILGIIAFVIIRANQSDFVNPNAPVGQMPGYAKGNTSGQPPVNMSQPNGGRPGMPGGGRPGMPSYMGGGGGR